jgi:hypothetical protein
MRPVWPAVAAILNLLDVAIGLDLQNWQWRSISSRHCNAHKAGGHDNSANDGSYSHYQLPTQASASCLQKSGFHPVNEN